jgi:hypothetical protein
MKLTSTFVLALLSATASTSSSKTADPTTQLIYPSARQQEIVSTAKQVALTLPPTLLTAAIRGIAVDANGTLFVAGISMAGLSLPSSPSSIFGFLASASGTLNTLAPAAHTLFTVGHESGKNAPSITGARFQTNGSILLADSANQRVLSVDIRKGRATTFCEDNTMLGPTDMAISAFTDSYLFLSGSTPYLPNSNDTTIAGESGGLWVCTGSGYNNTIRFPTSYMAKAGVHRTTGVETSPDGKWTYLASSKVVNGVVTENKIFRFVLEAGSLRPVWTPPEVWYDFPGFDASTFTLGGMRMDTQGNLYVALNGAGEIIRLAPSGQLLGRIILPKLLGPSSLEFGGTDGKTLYVVGECEGHVEDGCAASLQTTQTGRAWSALNAALNDGQ